MPEKDRPMSTFIIHTHGRLQEWVAEEKGYFAAEGLTDYALSSHGLLSPDHVRANTPPVPLAAGRLASPNSPLARIAQSHGATASQIALAWLLQRSPAMLPIPGTSSIAHFEENLASASIRLSAAEFFSGRPRRARLVAK